MVEMTFQLMQQFEVDEEATKVAGNLQRPFHVDSKEIQGRYEITATIDFRMLDEDFASKKLDLLAKLAPLKESTMLYKMAVEAVDPDAADAMISDQVSPAAQEKEKRQVRDDVTAMFQGIETPLPMTANHQLHIQTIQQILSQPNVMARLQALPDTQKLIQNRMQFHQRQIQQYQVNPTVGRALQTKAFQPQQAPELQYSSPREQ
jgi:hypothetical protein